MTIKSAIITGATGGFAQALIAHLLETSSCERIYALSRRAPEHADKRVIALPFEAHSDESIQKAAQKITADKSDIDLIVQSAALLHDDAQKISPEKRVENISREALERAFAVNAFAPILFLKALMPLLTSAPNKESGVRIANVSARVGSISDNGLGGWYTYRASKAAQNQLTKTFAIELKRRSPQSIVFAYHPGTIDTALSKPFNGRTPREKLFTPEQSARYFFDLLSSLTRDKSGGFFAWDGQEIEF